MQAHSPASILTVVGVLVLAGSPVHGSAADSRLIPITTPAGTIVQAEVADTPLKRARGLMYRDQLDKNHGMLFVFDQPQAWGFWMKNTKIPLDMIWIDAQKRVVHVERHVPICTKTDDSCPLYKPNSEDAMYVLELAAGAAEEYKIEKNSRLEFKIP
ncbi:MAG: DUF192 domain-containing protein [Nitrospira sp.]|nr:DUF192 domain-containing protein [Nitrospira sp.]